jgi:hypothetical protein
LVDIRRPNRNTASFAKGYGVPSRFLASSKTARELLLLLCMRSTDGPSDTLVLPEAKSKKDARKSVNQANRRIDSEYALEEIAAYIAIRDGLLSEAEKAATCESLRRVATANDFVETCLRPARSPYEAQFLAEADAARERKRCEMVKVRIAQLGRRTV